MRSTHKEEKNLEALLHIFSYSYNSPQFTGLCRWPFSIQPNSSICCLWLLSISSPVVFGSALLCFKRSIVNLFKFIHISKLKCTPETFLTICPQKHQHPWPDRESTTTVLLCQWFWSQKGQYRLKFVFHRNIFKQQRKIIIKIKERSPSSMDERQKLLLALFS